MENPDQSAAGIECWIDFRHEKSI